MSFITDHMLVCANVLHDPSEDSFYKSILNTNENNELVLINPEVQLTTSGQIEPFKTKSKIKHSPPKSPSISHPTSQDIFIEESPQNPEILKVFADKIFKGKDEEIYETFSKNFNEFLEKKTNILFINWFKKLAEEGFLTFLRKKLQNFPNLQFSISGFSTEIENKKAKYQEISAFEKEIQFLRSNNKRNINGIIYRFRVKSPETHRKNHLIIVDLFNSMEKVSGFENLYEGLTSVAKSFYQILTDKTQNQVNFFSFLMNFKEF